MTYLKVRWVHNLADEPYLILCELDDDRYEVRKIEYFPDGTIGYASEVFEVGDTRLGILQDPTADEIASDPQFIVEELSDKEFEAAWRRATS